MSAMDADAEKRVKRPVLQDVAIPGNVRKRSDESNVASLLQEMKRLRQENEQLRRKTQDVVPSKVRSLGRRGYGLDQPFNIRGWTPGEQHASSGESQIVPLEDKAGHNSSSSRPGPPGHFWSGGSLSSHSRLNADCELESALLKACAPSSEPSESRFKEAFALHIHRVERPLLEFSAAMAPFFSEVSQRQGSAAALRHLALLLRSLISSPLPGVRAEHCSRAEHVRSCVAQACLSLDLARLGFGERRWQLALEKRARKQKEEALDGTPQPIAAIADAQDAAESPQCRTPFSVEREVSRDELEFSIERARNFLLAVVMDMDRLEDAVETHRQKLMQNDKSTSLQSFGLPDDVDPANVPSFGKFFASQLLPLCVGDVPWKRLRDMASSIVGDPLDSDDEEKAWKANGMQRPASRKPEQRLRKRREAGDKKSEEGSQASLEERPDSTLLVPQENNRIAEIVEQARKKAGPYVSGPSLMAKASTYASGSSRISSKASTVASSRPASDASSGATSSLTSMSMKPPVTPATRAVQRNDMKAFGATPHISAALLMSPNTQAQSRRSALFAATPISWRHTNSASGLNAVTTPSSVNRAIDWDVEAMN